MSIHLNRNMESQEQAAQRIKGSAESRHSVEASYALYGHTPPPESVHEIQGEDKKSCSKNFKELRQLGAVDFYGTTDLVEAETWLKRTERVFGMIRCTLEE